MATLRFEQFGGLIPRTHPTLLPRGCATVAHNCKLKNGKLVPVREPIAIAGKKVNYEAGLNSIGDARTLYLWKLRNGTSEFVAWKSNDIDVTEGNISNDSYSRLFVTGTTGVGDNGTDPIVLMKSEHSNSIARHSLVKEQLDKPIVILDDGCNADPTNTRYTYFFQTWVDRYGYESGVSDAGKLYVQKYRKVITTAQNGVNTSTEWYQNYDTTTPLTTAPTSDDLMGLEIIGTTQTTLDDTLVATTFYGIETGYNNGDSIILHPLSKVPHDAVARRLYKVVTGSQTDNIQFIHEAQLRNVDLVIVKDEDAGEVIPMIEPPPTTMRGIQFVPGGFYAAFRTDKPKTVMFSDVSVPTSYPEAYQYDVRDNVVALAVTGNTVYVLTDGSPYAFTGTAPEAMTSSALKGPAACVSKKSVVVKNGVVYFASNEGIATISQTLYAGPETNNITEKIWTKEQWKALKPETCLIGVYDGALHLFFEKTSYILNLNDGTAALTSHDEKTACICVDESEDELYFVRRAE